MLTATDFISNAASILNNLSFILIRVFRIRRANLSCDPADLNNAFNEYRSLLQTCNGEAGPYPAKVMQYKAKKLGLRSVKRLIT